MDVRPLRIAYPVPKLQIGGAELQMLALAERLPRDRFEVDFLSWLGEGPLDERCRAAGGRVHRLGDRALSTSSPPIRAIGRVAKMGRYAMLARSSRYDIIDAWLYPSDVLATLGRFATRTPVVVSGRVDLLPRDGFGPMSAKVDGITNKRVDAIVANSQVVATATRGQLGVDAQKLHVIYNGVDLPEPSAPAERRRVRSELGVGDTDVLIGAVGSLREVKRHTLLIDAFSDIAPSHPELHLAIVGEGLMREELERQVERLGLGPRVRLPGAYADVRPFFDAFDMVAMSSHSEGMPNVLLEAGAAGRPIVTTAAGGAVEAVIDGTSGLVVPVEDRDALARALAELASDADRRARYGAAGRDHIATAFGMERFVRQWTDLYHDLAVSKGLLPA